VKLGFRGSVRGVLGATLMSLAAVGCGEERAPSAPRPIADGGLFMRPHVDAGVAFGRCVSGTVRDCSVVIGVHNGVISCFYGKQVGIDESWGPCGDAENANVEDVPGAVAAGAVPAGPIDAGAPPP